MGHLVVGSTKQTKNQHRLWNQAGERATRPSTSFPRCLNTNQRLMNARFASAAFLMFPIKAKALPLRKTSQCCGTRFFGLVLSPVLRKGVEARLPLFFALKSQALFVTVMGTGFRLSFLDLILQIFLNLVLKFCDTLALLPTFLPHHFSLPALHGMLKRLPTSVVKFGNWEQRMPFCSLCNVFFNVSREQW